MKVFELRGFLKERGVRGFSMMKKSELEAKVQKLKEQEKAEKYEENLRDTAVCAACLGEQRIQRKIDEKDVCNQTVTREHVIRILFCDFCQHAKSYRSMGITLSASSCGTLQIPTL